MSPLRSRLKGKVFEREVADLYRQRWPAATVRRGQQGDGAHEPDVVIEGDAPLFAQRMWTECQDAIDPTPREKLAQAERDILALPSEFSCYVPIVVWHKLRARTIQVTTPLWVLARCGLFHLVDNFDHPGELLPVTLDFHAFLAALP